MTTTRPSWIDDGSPIDDPFGYGERAVQWLRRLKHPKARNRVFHLDPWQERIIRRIYGPRKPDGTRIVTTVLLLLPRGNRKTSLAAAIVLLHLLGPEKVPGCLIQSAASARKQARECFEEVALITNLDKRIRPHIRLQDYKNRVTYPKQRTRYEALSADAGVQHGSTPSVVVADELHAWKKRDLWDVLDSSLTKTKGSLMVIATTAGRGSQNVAHEKVEYGRKVQAGEVDDPSFLPVIFEASKDADWQDEAVWHAVNPGLKHGYPDLDAFRERAVRAVNSPGDREQFLQLNLNVWLDYSRSPFVVMNVYDEGRAPIDLDELTELPCWLAVDMSTSIDLTAVVACWRRDDRFIVHPWFFCPEDQLRERAVIDKVPYPAWLNDGFISVTPGAIIGHDVVADHIRGLCARFDVREINFDPARASLIMADLLEDGLPVTRFDQSWRMMVPAVDILKRAILNKQLQHGGHPVLRWHFENVSMTFDRNGNETFAKNKSVDRIDGAVATAMAVARAAANDNTRSIFESDNFEELMKA